MQQIKQRLQSEAYDFLHTNPDLKNCIYLTLSGSYGYGTNVEGSDIDLRGVLVEQPHYLFGLDKFEQFEENTTDTVIYGLKKFISLCMTANPNTLELLGTDESCIVLQTEAGQLLREHASLFLSRRVIGSFGNYASAQLRRLCNALCHDQYAQDEQEVHLAATLKGQIEHFNRTYTPFGEHAMHIYQAKGDLLMDVSLNGYPVRDFAGIYGEMQNTIKSYAKLNHRNRKKDEPHLYKHAMHLIRLLITGIDILNGNGIITKRTAEHTFLMDIRNGVYSFDEIKRLAREYQAKFEEAAANTQLPPAPDSDKVNALMMQLYEHILA